MDKESVIELENVGVFHTSDLGVSQRHEREMVLSQVNLSVTQGEMVYFIGRVGSGKSSLLKLLYGEIPLLEGRGRIVGFDLGSLRRKDIPRLRRSVGIVFQNYQLLDDRTAFDNLHFVMRATGWRDEAQIRRRINQLMQTVGLQNKEYKMPFELSGGEQQRLAIARAMINDPKVILADEPTGNLDPGAAAEVMRLFGRIVESGCSIVMTTHNIANIEQYPSRTLRFSKGRVEEINIRQILHLA